MTEKDENLVSRDKNLISRDENLVSRDEILLSREGGNLLLSSTVQCKCTLAVSTFYALFTIIIIFLFVSACEVKSQYAGEAFTDPLQYSGALTSGVHTNVAGK